MKPVLPAPLDYHETDLLARRLLVIDDDDALLMAVAKVLRHAGADVKTANGVVEGIALLAAEGAVFDAVLTDLRMEPAGGKTIVSILKGTYPDVPVIVMSAYWTSELKEECARLGVSTFLDKPLRSWHLVSSVAKALMGHKDRRR